MLSKLKKWKYYEFKYEMEEEKLKQVYWNFVFCLQDANNLRLSKYMILKTKLWNIMIKRYIYKFKCVESWHSIN